MIILKRSKINAMIELLNHNNSYIENDDAEYLMSHIYKTLEIRKKISINNNFTSDEFKETANFVKLLNNEEYEKLTNYYVDENQ